MAENLKQFLQLYIHIHHMKKQAENILSSCNFLFFENIVSFHNAVYFSTLSGKRFVCIRISAGQLKFYKCIAKEQTCFKK